MPQPERVERSAKRVRVMFGGVTVADTLHPWLVWERPFYPTYYFPAEDVRAEHLVESGSSDRPGAGGAATTYTVEAAGRLAADAAYRYPDATEEGLRRAVAFRWASMDHWFEEDAEVFVHARDPYKRIDILASSRRVRVDIGGVTVAESTRPVLLFETGLPVRYYLPMVDVRLDLLTPSDRVTECPYKGTARYWSVGDERDVVWSYPFPTLESAGIAGLVCFYEERVELTVDP